MKEKKRKRGAPGVAWWCWSRSHNRGLGGVGELGLLGSLGLGVVVVVVVMVMVMVGGWIRWRGGGG